MHPLDDLIRALAPLIRDLRPEDLTEHRARSLYLTVAHDDRCPRCGAEALILTHDIACPACGRASSLTAHTPLHHTKLSLRHVLLAIWHVFVDTETKNACAFARAYALRRPTAWALLHRVRDAVPHEAPTTRGAVTQLTGRENPTNTVHVALVVEDDGLRVAPVEDSPPAAAPPTARSSLWLGHLRAWVTSHFKMISRRHVCRYLRDFAARYRRVSLTSS